MKESLITGDLKANIFITKYYVKYIDNVKITLPIKFFFFFSFSKGVKHEINNKETRTASMTSF